MKRASLNKKMNKFINTTPKRMKGRPNVPPPLNLDPLTPPPTIQQPKRIHDEFQLDSPFLGSSNPYNLDEEEDESPTFQIKHNKQNNKSFLKNNCCFCEEPLINKLSGERILELDCNHQSHYDCYSLMINKQDINDFPICCICSKRTKPIDDDIIEELYSKTLVEDEEEDEEEDSIMELPKPQYSSTPFTPQEQIINNCSSAGFQSSKQSRFSLASSMDSSISNNSQYSIEDLIKPNVHIISEFNKVQVFDTNDDITIGSVLNIFTSKFGEDSKKNDDEFKLKQDINGKIVEILQGKIIDNKGINLSNLSKLRIFDFVEISLDGYNWEFVQFFIFMNFLLILNEEGDSIIGTIMIKEHFSKLIKINDSTIILYFISSTLPELQIRSNNKILISKWIDFFNNKLHKDLEIPLIQMTTNGWDLINDGTMGIPLEVVRFNELTSKGLDLPFQLMKNFLPRPSILPKAIIMTISLINTTRLTNDEYLENLQGIIKSTLSELGSNVDKFGLVIIGRDGNRVVGLGKGTFIGMVNSSWSGWGELIEELQVFQSKIGYLQELKIGLRTVEKLISTVPELNNDVDDYGVRKLMLISGNEQDDEGVLNEGLIHKIMIDYKFSIHQVLICENYSKQHEYVFNMINGFENHHQFQFNRFNEFSKFIEEIPQFFTQMDKIIISQFNIELKIENPDFIKFESIESNGVMQKIDQDNLKLFINDMIDGDYENIKFNISIDLAKLKKEYDVPFNQFVELPILNYSYNYNGIKSKNSIFKLKLQIQESTSTRKRKIETMSLMSPIENKFEDDGDVEFIDIPLLPPLSSFKDSIYVKKQIELMILEILRPDDTKGINELISLIFGLIRGCSTNYTSFYKDSKFNEFFKNFNNYVDFLIGELNKLQKAENDDEFNRMRLDFINSIKIGEY